MYSLCAERCVYIHQHLSIGVIQLGNIPAIPNITICWIYVIQFKIIGIVEQNVTLMDD